MKTRISLVLIAFGCLLGTVRAEIILRQDFESSLFSAPNPSTSYINNGTDTEGKWGPFRTPNTTTPFNWITNTAYHDGSKALVTRNGAGGNGPIGIRTDISVQTPDFEAILWCCRVDTTSAMSMSVTGVGNNGNYYDNRNMVKVIIKTDGKVAYINGSGQSVDTDITIPKNEWIRIRWNISRDSEQVRLYVQQDGKEVLAAHYTSPNLNNIQFNTFFCVPSGLTGGAEKIILDDFLIQEVPENPVYVSWGDSIFIGSGDDLLDTPQKIERSIKRWADNFHGKTILWRMSDYDYVRNCAFVDSYMKDRFYELHSQFSHVIVARDAAIANGLNFMFYTAMLDYGSPPSILYGGSPFPWQFTFTVQNPQLQAVDRNGNYHFGVLELAYPAARQAIIDRISQYAQEFQVESFGITTATHSKPAEYADQFGFSQPVVDEFYSRYGINILADPGFDCTSSQFDKNDPMVEAWRELRGEYFVQFFRELRAALPGKTIYVGIPRGRYFGPPYGNMYLNWESLVQEQLVDGLILGVYSGRWNWYSGTVPTDESRGYLCSEDDGLNIPSLEECTSTVYGPLCRANGVKLFFSPDTNAMEPHMQQFWDSHSLDLQGFMLTNPEGEYGTGTIEHSDELCCTTGQLTVEAYIFPRSICPAYKGVKRILGKYGDRGLNNSPDYNLKGWELMWYDDGRVAFHFNLPPRDGSYAPGDSYLIKTTDPLPLNQWSHVAAVFDAYGKTFKFYINGTLDQGSVYEFPIVPTFIRLNPNQDLFVGRSGGRGGMTVFDGLIDEVRISKTARTFTSAPSQPYTGNDSDTVALYHFDSVVDQNRIIDSAPGNEHPLALLNKYGNANLSQSLTGFGEALDVRMPGVILEEGFESSLFAVPSPATVDVYGGTLDEGKWGPFRTPDTSNPFNWLIDTVYHSGKKALATRNGAGGNGPIGLRTDKSVQTSLFEAAFWCFRADATSSMSMSVTGSGNGGNYYNNRNAVKITIQTNGKIAYINSSGQTVYTNITIPQGQWTKIRWNVERDTNRINLYVTQNDTETSAASYTSSNLNNIQFNTFFCVPTGLTGGAEKMILDDFVIQEIRSETIQDSSQIYIPGDSNGDGIVDVGDLGILAANYGGTGKAWEQGDFNNDGVVDVGDLGILAAHYGEGSTLASNFSEDYSRTFGINVEKNDIEETKSSICSGLGLPLMAGLLLFGLGRMGCERIKD
jgi:hypothetical protein